MQKKHLSASLFRQLPIATRQATIDSLSPSEAGVLLYDWPFWARDNQLPPSGQWTHWLLLAGRGFGKTRTGAEWVRYRVENKLSKRLAFVAPTSADARDIMVEGESGILAISPPWFRPKYEPAKRRLTWPCGAQATLFSADEPDRLRGPQHDGAWVDELSSWRYQQKAWDMLLFGLRLGEHPQTCITTTPKPTALIKSLMSDPRVKLTHGTTFDNMDNLAPTFKDEIIHKYEGTRLGRQELMAEVLSDVPGALWSRSLIEKSRRQAPQDFDKIILAVDPPVSTGRQADECGAMIIGMCSDRTYLCHQQELEKKHCYVLADMTTQGLSPLEWSENLLKAYYHYHIDEMIVEINQGGDLVESLIYQQDKNVVIQPVRAVKSKLARAEPVAMLYEKGLVHHCDNFTELEEQMCQFSTQGYHNGGGAKSPDRVDALVWGVTALLLNATQKKPRMRGL